MDAFSDPVYPVYRCSADFLNSSLKISTYFVSLSLDD